MLARSDFYPLWRLALPLVLSGFVEASLGLTNTLFLSRLGPDNLAAGALVIWFFATLMVIIWGVFTGVSVLVSHAYGAEDTRRVSAILKDALWLSVFLTIPLFFLIWNLAAVFTWLGQSPQMIAKAIPYMHALAFSVLPDLVGLTLMQFLIGLGRTKTNLIFALTWVPINIFLNDVLVFGHLGLPALGVAGLGWGATLSYWLTSFGLGLYLLLHPAYRRYVKLLRFFSKIKYCWELIKVGLPMGLMYSLEIGFFLTLSLLMGKMGIDELDGNQIALQYLGFLSTFSFSMAQAITVRMGHKLGAKENQLAHRAALAGIITAACFMSLVALAYWLIPTLLIGLDFNLNTLGRPVLIHAAIEFLGVMGIFQLLESVRLTLFGALRAYKDTKFTLMTSVICFWGIALPLGYVCSKLSWVGPTGFWWAAALGALVNIILLSVRYRKHYR